jgi:hypothetical protein
MVRVPTGLPSFSITYQKSSENFTCNSSPVNWADGVRLLVIATAYEET